MMGLLIGIVVDYSMMNYQMIVTSLSRCNDNDNGDNDDRVHDNIED